MTQSNHMNMPLPAISLSSAIDAQGSVFAQPSKSVRHYILGLPIAGVLTLALGGVMAMLIAQDEFTFNEPETIVIGAINPVEPDLDPPADIDPPQLMRVEAPPAPPIIATGSTDLPWEPIASDPVIPSLPIGHDFVLTSVTSIQLSNLAPLVRIPPTMPPRANRSGHCKMQFDVSAEGAPYNIRALSCSQSLFERASIKSVERWKYRPQIRGGRAVAVIGNTDTIRYKLLDDRGRVIAE